MRVGRRSIEVSHPEKLLFPVEEISKKEVVDYYVEVAPSMLRYLRGRPLTMHRFPDGVEEEGFFQKSIPDYFPDWIDRVEVEKEGGTVTHVVCEKQACLAYLANQGCLTPHIWLSRRENLNCPDLAVFDLDPAESSDPRLHEAVLKVRRVIEAIEIRCWIKTSGSRGFHLVFGLDGKVPYEQVRAFCRDLADFLAEESPALFTTESRKEKRGDRIFVDYLRNSYAQTVVAPYALRARQGAPVSTPLSWEEFEQGTVQPDQFKLEDVRDRVRKDEDPWKKIFRHRYSATRAHERLKGL